MLEEHVKIVDDYFQNVRYGTMEWESWNSIKNDYEELAKQPTNSDYAAALRVATEFQKNLPSVGRGLKWRSFKTWCKSRLNSDEPNCA